MSGELVTQGVQELDPSELMVFHLQRGQYFWLLTDWYVPAGH